MITQPINFNNTSAMNTWYSGFEEKAIAICEKYNVLDLWERTKILKDDTENKIAIVSMGTWLKGSKTHLAANEIIEAFNSHW